MGIIGTKRIVLFFAFLAIGPILVWLAFWIPGLPGPLHGAYLARGSLHNLYTGLQEYNEKNGHLPPATAIDEESGERSSWRTEVYQSSVRLGFIEPPKKEGNDSIEYDYHKAWNDPENLRLQDLGGWLFNYTQTDFAPDRQSGKYGLGRKTFYKAITGNGTAFDDATRQSLKQLPCDLILIVRVERSDTHWLEPGDLKIAQLASAEQSKRLLLGEDGYIVLFADGEGWVLSGRLAYSDLCKFFTIEGAKKYNREDLLTPFRILP